MFLIKYLFPTIVMVSFYLYILSYITKKRINFRSILNYIIIFLLIISIVAVFAYFNNFMRIVLDFFIISIASKFLLEESFSKCFMATFFMFVYFFIAEMVASIVLVLTLGKESFLIVKELAGGVWINLEISLIALLIAQLRMLNNLFEKMIVTHQKSAYNEVIILIIVSAGVLANNNVNFLGMNISFLGNILLVILFSIIIWFLLKEKEKSNQLSLQYDHLFKYIQEYEKELKRKNMRIHEFNNQLISIKGYISNKNKKLNDYVTGILNESKESKSKCLSGMENIPKDGLKGLIYYKLGYLYEENIKVLTRVNGNVKRSKFSRIDPNIYKDIVKIVGVLLDNAVEAARLSKKKQIVLEIYLQKNIFHLILSNTYKENIDLKNIGVLGYSTKGKGRGYGLSLVNELISKYQYIKQERNITIDYYTIHLAIDMKNIPIVK
jgi:two-component system sensor histidine kinase AgrC